MVMLRACCFPAGGFGIAGRLEGDRGRHRRQNQNEFSHEDGSYRFYCGVLGTCAQPDLRDLQD